MSIFGIASGLRTQRELASLLQQDLGRYVHIDYNKYDRSIILTLLKATRPDGSRILTASELIQIPPDKFIDSPFLYPALRDRKITPEDLFNFPKKILKALLTQNGLELLDMINVRPLNKRMEKFILQVLDDQYWHWAKQILDIDLLEIEEDNRHLLFSEEGVQKMLSNREETLQIARSTMTKKNRINRTLDFSRLCDYICD